MYMFYMIMCVIYNLPDCMLRLDREEETTGEAAYILDTGNESVIIIIVEIQISMTVRD